MGDDRQDPPKQRPASDADDADRTQRIPPPGGDSTPSGGTTAHHEPVDTTRPLPPGELTGQTSRPPPWSGRAEVRPAQPADDIDPGYWYAPQERTDRRWWLPIVVGIVALLLLGILGYGVWLIVRSTQEEPGPAPPPSPVPSEPGPLSPSAPAPSTADASESTGQPTAPQTTAAPTTARVRLVPPLVGLSQDQAVTVLERFDLDYRIRTRESDRPPGTVIATEPGPGDPVPDDEEITLVIAIPRVAPSVDPSTSTSEPRPGR